MIDVHIITVDSTHPLYGWAIGCTCGNLATGETRPNAERHHTEHLALCIDANRAADKVAR